MRIKEYKKDQASFRFVVFAVGNGAITSAKKAFENDLIKQNAFLYLCDNEPLGCGGNVALGRQMAEDDIENGLICEDGNHCVVTQKAIVVATLGGGTGTGATPVVAKYLHDRGIEVTIIVSLPFSFEGPAKQEKCQAAIKEMSNYAITTIVINNDVSEKYHKGGLGKHYFAKTVSLIENGILYATCLMKEKNIITRKKPWYKRLLGI